MNELLNVVTVKPGPFNIVARGHVVTADVQPGPGPNVVNVWFQGRFMGTFKNTADKLIQANVMARLEEPLDLASIWV